MLSTLATTRRFNKWNLQGLKKVLAGVDLALQLGYRPVKINVVLMKGQSEHPFEVLAYIRHTAPFEGPLIVRFNLSALCLALVVRAGFNDDEIVDFVEYTRTREVEVRFIEFMPFTGNKWDDSKLVPHLDAVRALLEQYPEAAPALPRPNDTARVSVHFECDILTFVVWIAKLRASFPVTAGVAGAGALRPRGVHLFNDQKLLLHLQSPAAHGRWELEGTYILLKRTSKCLILIQRLNTENFLQ